MQRDEFARTDPYRQVAAAERRSTILTDMRMHD
jgi:hypothetical protein